MPADWEPPLPEEEAVQAAWQTQLEGVQVKSIRSLAARCCAQASCLCWLGLPDCVAGTAPRCSVCHACVPPEWQSAMRPFADLHMGAPAVQSISTVIRCI